MHSLSIERKSTRRKQKYEVPLIVRRDSGPPTHGVILNMFTKGNHWYAATLTTTGAIYTLRVSDFTFVIPGFVSPDLSIRCRVDDEDSLDAHARAARLQVLKRARDFERAVEDVTNSLGTSIVNLYPQVRAESSDAWSRITTIEAARLLVPQPKSPIMTLLAVQKHLLKRDLEFVAPLNFHRQDASFDVRPQSHAENLQVVKSWIREKSTVIDAFAFKARRLIERSCALAAESADEPPSEPIPSGLLFSRSDWAIVSLLLRSLRRSRHIQTDPYAVHVPAIVKAVGMYEIDGTSGEIDSSTVVRLLKDIAVFTPWEDVMSRNKDVEALLADHNLQKSAVANIKLTKRGRASVYSPSAQSGFLSPTMQTGLLSSDPHESVRHDFGMLPVYVVDGLDAEERDDGISIETIPGEPDAYWIHVHIADPTAVLPLEHSITLQARRQLQTIYYVHKTLPMLPTPLVSQRIGLQETDGDEAQKVLTFSCKIDETGEIIGHNVRAGIVRNVAIIDYDTVDRLLGENATLWITYPFGRRDSAPPGPGGIDLAGLEQHRDQLDLLMKATRRLVRSRMRLPMIQFAYPFAELTMHPRPPPENNTESRTPVYYRGFPTLTYSVHHPEQLETGARSMIAECMKVACRVASRFCLEKGVPMIRRGTDKNEMVDNPDFQKLLGMRNDKGFVDMKELAKVDLKMPLARYTLDPIGHWGLGIRDGEGYIRATSPLRRFMDAIAHWQIKSALLPASSAGSKPPFSHSELQQLISEVRPKEQTLNSTERFHLKYWAHAYLHRLRETRIQQDAKGLATGDDPLRLLDAFVVSGVSLELRHRRLRCDVYIPSLGLAGDLLVDKGPRVALGDAVTVSVKDIILGMTPKLVVEFAGS